METRRTENLRGFDIWKRKGVNGVVRYRCFEDESTGRFCVQSADFYQSPSTADYISQLERQFIELLIEQSPFTRSGSFASIEEAITDHDKSFKEPLNA
jgi:hypothetical protein